MRNRKVSFHSLFLLFLNFKTLPVLYSFRIFTAEDLPLRKQPTHFLFIETGHTDRPYQFSIGSHHCEKQALYVSKYKDKTHLCCTSKQRNMSFLSPKVYEHSRKSGRHITDFQEGKITEEKYMGVWRVWSVSAYENNDALSHQSLLSQR